MLDFSVDFGKVPTDPTSSSDATGKDGVRLLDFSVDFGKVPTDPTSSSDATGKDGVIVYSGLFG